MAEDSNTKLLLHLDTDFSDAMGNHTPNAVDAPIISTGSPKFGDGHLLAEHLQTGDALFDKHDDFVLGTSDFTVDFWFRRTGNPSDFNSSIAIFGGHNAGSVNGRWRIYIVDGSFTSVNLQLHQVNNFSTTLIIGRSIATISDNTWYHLAVVRSGDLAMIFKDGVKIGGDESLSPGLNILYTPTQGVKIGGNYTGANDVDALYDEFRFSRVARWTEDFTPPTEPYVGTSEGTSFIPRLTLLGVG